MGSRSKLRGHPITWDGKCHRYDDTVEKTVATHKSRPCGRCGEFTGKDGIDPCLGRLPGVMNACCGHGTTAEAYVQFSNGVRIEGFVVSGGRRF